MTQFRGFIQAVLRLAERSQPMADHRAALLVELARADLHAWGHADHEITLEQTEPHFADASRLRCTFWCETCNVARVVFLPAPED